VWHRDSRRSCDTSGVVDGGVAGDVRLSAHVCRLAVCRANGNARVRRRGVARSLGVLSVACGRGVLVRRADGAARVSRRSNSICLSVLGVARNGRLTSVAQGQDFALRSRSWVDGHVYRGVVLRLRRRSLRILIILAVVREIVDWSGGRLRGACGLLDSISL
jgi:hypothetical protein